MKSTFGKIIFVYEMCSAFTTGRSVIKPLFRSQTGYQNDAADDFKHKKVGTQFVENPSPHLKIRHLKNCLFGGNDLYRDKVFSFEAGGRFKGHR